MSESKNLIEFKKGIHISNDLEKKLFELEKTLDSMSFNSIKQRKKKDELKEINNYLLENTNDLNEILSKAQKNIDNKISLLIKEVDELNNIKLYTEKKIKQIEIENMNLKEDNIKEKNIFEKNSAINNKKIEIERKILLTKIFEIQEFLEEEIFKNKDYKRKEIVLKKKINQIKDENKILLSKLIETQEKYECLKEKYKFDYSENDTKLFSKDNSLEIKKDIRYELGAKIIASSKKMKNIKNIPFILYKELYKIDKDKMEELLKENNAINEIKGSAKNHLSYRIGNALFEAKANPSTVNMIKLPFNLVCEIVKFKLEK